MTDDKYFAETPKRLIREALWLDIHKGREAELDWDFLNDREKMQALYKETNSLRIMGERLGITDARCRIILKIHGIPIRQRGGVMKKKKPEELPPLDLSAVHEIGAGYGKELRKTLIIHSSERVRTCPAQCPNAIPCWSAPIRGKRAKKQDCTLRDHLIAVGVINV